MRGFWRRRRTTTTIFVGFEEVKGWRRKEEEQQIFIGNGGNKNHLSCKIPSKVLYHSMVMKLWSKQVFLFKNFYYHLIPHLSMVMHSNEFYVEYEMIEVG